MGTPGAATPDVSLRTALLREGSPFSTAQLGDPDTPASMPHTPGGWMPSSAHITRICHLGGLESMYSTNRNFNSTRPKACIRGITTMTYCVLGAG